MDKLIKKSENTKKQKILYTISLVLQVILLMIIFELSKMNNWNLIEKTVIALAFVVIANIPLIYQTFFTKEKK